MKILVYSQEDSVNSFSGKLVFSETFLSADGSSDVRDDSYAAMFCHEGPWNYVHQRIWF